MPTRSDLASRAAALNAAGTPFVWATVVRAERPTSAKPGDAALVLSDGELDGFVGGDCAEATVRAHALEALATGETRMLRITPEPESAPQEPGIVRVHNACLSGGTLDVFLEPSRPLPVVAVYGHAPIAAALIRADRVFGQRIRALSGPDDPLPAGHGRRRRRLAWQRRAGCPVPRAAGRHRLRRTGRQPGTRTGRPRRPGRRRRSSQARAHTGRLRYRRPHSGRGGVVDLG